MTDQPIARVAPRETSPLLLAVKKFVPRNLYGRTYTTHYKLGGMRCKLYGASFSRIPRGLKAWLTKLGYKNITILGNVRGPYRHPCVTVFASFGDQWVAKNSPIKLVAKQAAPHARPAKAAEPSSSSVYEVVVTERRVIHLRQRMTILADGEQEARQIAANRVRRFWERLGSESGVTLGRKMKALT